MRSFSSIRVALAGAALVGFSVNAFAGEPVPGPGRASAPLSENTDLLRLLPRNGNTVYPASKLLRKWSEGGPKMLWQMEVGGGRTAVVEAGGRAYTEGQSDGSQWGYCLDPKSGSIVWKHLLLPKENHHVMNGPVATPVLDGDRIYFVPYDNYKGDMWDPRCPVVCTKADGTEIWREAADFWCTEGSTPLIVGDTLYMASGSAGHIMAAADKMTGKLRWVTRLDTDKKRIFAGACSVTYMEVAGIPQVIGYIWGPHIIVGVDARDGHILWQYTTPGPLSSGMVSTPVAVGNRLLLSGAQNTAFFVCLEITPKNGGLDAREVYAFRDRQGNSTHTVAVFDNAVFGFGGKAPGALECIDLTDGKLLWENCGEDWTRDQQLIIADGLLFAVTKQSSLVMAEANRSGYRELGRVKLPFEMGKFPQQPTIANGKLYIRSDRNIVCYQVAEGG